MKRRPKPNRSPPRLFDGPPFVAKGDEGTIAARALEQVAERRRSIVEDAVASTAGLLFDNLEGCARTNATSSRSMV
ncbi:hypothetical protein [Phenylobacterium sp.]|uniref:hypothetical protein n=1 Tax=Phenylobacterium sp. TaxID=1871053 RepID=UPI0025F26C33|nr:hypothetical protein [Phenylobacterium sp.]MBX3482012.1 hypothetical protein [Phenylobacterium sp.]MCW5758238.1 hypothetical protein [Phenylobacterium sp.]